MNSTTTCYHYIAKPSDSSPYLIADKVLGYRGNFGLVIGDLNASGTNFVSPFNLPATTTAIYPYKTVCTTLQATTSTSTSQMKPNDYIDFIYLFIACAFAVGYVIVRITKR